MGFLIIALIYAAFIVAFFVVKLNRSTVVQSSRDVHGEVEAIDFYWRPG